MVSEDLSSFTFYDWVLFALNIIDSYWNLEEKVKGHYS